VHVGRSGNRLLRLGECAFDFDLVEALGPGAVDRDIFLDGLREALGSTPPQALRFVVHPPVATTFLSLAEGGDVESAAHRDARLLGLLDDEGMNVRIDHLDGHRATELVTLLPADLRDAISDVCAELGASAFEIVPGLLAVGETIRSASSGEGVLAGVGIFEGGVEIVAFESGLWRVGTSAAASAGSRADLLERAVESGVFGLEDGVRRYRFGSGWPDGEFPGLEDLWPLDGLSVVHYDEAGVDPATDPSLFAAAIGAAIL